MHISLKQGFLSIFVYFSASISDLWPALNTCVLNNCKLKFCYLIPVTTLFQIYVSSRPPVAWCHFYFKHELKSNSWTQITVSNWPPKLHSDRCWVNHKSAPGSSHAGGPGRQATSPDAETPWKQLTSSCSQAQKEATAGRPSVQPDYQIFTPNSEVNIKQHHRANKVP